MKNNKERRLDNPSLKKILLTLGLVLIILTSYFGGYFTYRAMMGSGQKTLDDVMSIMDRVGFVYDPELDDYVALEKDKIAKLIAGSFLDGYSAYYTQEEYQAYLESRSGDNKGFGITMLNANTSSEEQGTNVIYGVKINSPAHHAGLQTGDVIVGASYQTETENVNQTFTNGKQLKTFLDSVEQDVSVDFTIKRKGEVLPSPVSVVKSEYSTSFVTYSDDQVAMFFAPEYKQIIHNVEEAKQTIMEVPLSQLTDEQKLPVTLGDNDAYIKLDQFSGDAAYQFGAAMEYMLDTEEGRGKTDLILDLRGNGGGDMEILLQVASYLINKGDFTTVAIATEKLSSEGDMIDAKYNVKRFNVTTARFDERLRKITILADQNTASASECLIGAMIYYGSDTQPFTKENLILSKSMDKDGNPQYVTYGKGIMQTTYRLDSGGALKLTTAKLLWPDKTTCIHKKGITTDISENMVDDNIQALTRAVQILSN